MELENHRRTLEKRENGNIRLNIDSRDWGES